MDCSPPGSVHGFSGQEYWGGLPFLPPGDLPDPGTEPKFLMSPALADGSFTTSTTWEAPTDSASSVFLTLVPSLCPWDSPGKGTGVGCHFLLQGIFPA